MEIKCFEVIESSGDREGEQRREKAGDGGLCFWKTDCQLREKRLRFCFWFVNIFLLSSSSGLAMLKRGVWFGRQSKGRSIIKKPLDNNLYLWLVRVTIWFDSDWVASFLVFYDSTRTSLTTMLRTWCIVGKTYFNQ